MERGADDGALGDLVEVVALVDALVAHEARDEMRRLAQQAERGAEAARRAKVMRHGDGEGVLVDDAVPPAPRDKDDVARPAVRLDEVRVRLRLGVERARPPAWKSSGDVGAHTPIYIPVEARTFEPLFDILATQKETQLKGPEKL